MTLNWAWLGVAASSSAAASASGRGDAARSELKRGQGHGGLAVRDRSGSPNLTEPGRGFNAASARRSGGVTLRHNCSPQRGLGPAARGALGGVDGVGEQHRDRHRPDAARHRRDRRRRPAATPAKSTSPHSLPAALRFMPTSMTTAPGLTIAPVSVLARPTAATTTSARRVCAPRSGVRLWQIVTVASACEQHQRHRLADGVAAADDDRVLAAQVDAGALDQLHAAPRRARAKAGQAGDQAAGALDRVAVDVLVGARSPRSRAPARCASAAASGPGCRAPTGRR